MQTNTKNQHWFQEQVRDYFSRKNNSVQIKGNRATITSGNDKGLAFIFADNNCNISFNEFNLTTDISPDISIDAFVSVLVNHNLIYHDINSDPICLLKANY